MVILNNKQVYGVWWLAIPFLGFHIDKYKNLNNLNFS